MKTKIIGISIGVILIGLIIFILTKQENVEPPQVKEAANEGKRVPSPKVVNQEGTKPQIALKVAPKTVGASPIGKMPDPSDKEAMEKFFNKAFMAWNDKVASLIVDELKLGQEALDKYSAIRNDFYQAQFTIFQTQSSQEPQGTENKEGQRRLASALKNAKEILQNDHGINLDSDELNGSTDYPKVQEAIQAAMAKDSNQFLADHLKKVENVLGPEGFKKYQQLKTDFNNQITDEDQEPLFKI